MCKNKRILISALLSVSLLAGLLAGSVLYAQAPPAENPQDGAVGMQGRISAPPPTTAATISIPRNGQTFTELPITVSGICPTGLLIKVFKNEVFAGSTMCENGSYSITIDLFNGENQIITRVYDELDQAGPDSNPVTVTFNANRPGVGSRVSLTTNYAKRGANPKQTLTWPIILSGGEGPYAVSVDWGDGSSPDLQSRPYPGEVEIKHVYDAPGVYNIVVKASDNNGNVAYLQLVGMVNGPLSQEAGDIDKASDTTTEKTVIRILWQPAAVLVPLLIMAFWLGKKHQLKVLRQRIERGERPF